MPITACSGATERPWPNAMVTVLSSPQLRGRQWLGAFRDLGAQPVGLPELLEELLVVLDPERERHLGGADIGGVRIDFRYAQMRFCAWKSLMVNLP